MSWESKTLGLPRIFWQGWAPVWILQPLLRTEVWQQPRAVNRFYVLKWFSWNTQELNKLWDLHPTGQSWCNQPAGSQVGRQNEAANLCFAACVGQKSQSCPCLWQWTTLLSGMMPLGNEPHQGWGEAAPQVSLSQVMGDVLCGHHVKGTCHWDMSLNMCHQQQTSAVQESNITAAILLWTPFWGKQIRMPKICCCASPSPLSENQQTILSLLRSSLSSPLEQSCGILVFWLAPEMKMSIFTFYLRIMESQSRVGDQEDIKQMKLASGCVSDLWGVTTPRPVTFHQHSVLKWCSGRAQRTWGNRNEAEC